MNEDWTLDANQLKTFIDLDNDVQPDGQECFYQELIDHRLADHDGDKVVLTDAGRLAVADMLRQAEGQALEGVSAVLSFHEGIFYDLKPIFSQKSVDTEEQA